MSEPHPSEDKAAQYLLGDLTDADRREFEAELANSTELRALLRELEESSVLLAMTSPQRRPPTKVWQSIEKTVANEAKAGEPIPAFWTTQTWLGWAAAAAVLLGWLLYAFWVNHPSSQDLSKSGTTLQVSPANDAGPNAHASANSHQNSSPDKTSRIPAFASIDPQELLRLRRQVTELQNRVTNLSQAVAQQQSLLGESNRIKFFQLASTSGNSAAPPPSLSPALQRALFIAMARELGWLPSDDGSSYGTNTVFGPGGDVDFVDLRPATNGPPKIVPSPPNSQTASSSTPESSPTPNSAPVAIPAFTSGNNVVVAIDPSIVPAGTQVNFFNQDQQPIGWTTVGYNPVVITIPTSMGGGQVFITTGGLEAPLNTWQISNPVSANP